MLCINSNNFHIGGACRSRVTVNLRRKYSSPEEAERAMSICQPVQAKEKRFSLTAALQSMEIAEHSVSCKYKITGSVIHKTNTNTGA